MTRGHGGTFVRIKLKGGLAAHDMRPRLALEIILFAAVQTLRNCLTYSLACH